MKTWNGLCMGVQRCVIVGHTGSISVVECVIWQERYTVKEQSHTLWPMGVGMHNTHTQG